MYLDDWISRAILEERCRIQQLHLTKLVKEVGFVIHFPKSQIVPSQTFDFAGYNYRLDVSLVVPTTTRVQDLVTFCKKLLSVSFTTPRELM